MMQGMLWELPPRRVVSIVALALFAMAALTGCGGSEAGPETDAYGESNPVTVAGDSVTVEMRDIRFRPQGIRVKVGTTVTWLNDDSLAHNVRQVESVFLSRDVMEPGDAFAFSFDKPGRYRYQCTFHHPDMNGVVIVEEE